MDEVGLDGRHRGWADRVADALAQRALARGESGIRYANLAVRGRLVPQVIAEQVPTALRLQPDLASIAVGVNDSLRPHFDLHAVATDVERGVRALRRSGADVLVFAFGDPTRRSRLMRPVAERIRRYNSAVEAIAAEYGCYRVSFWQVAVFDDPRLWDEDWLHLSPVGHDLAARCALAALGLGDDDWRTPLVPERPPPVTRRVAANVRWGRDHLAPWVVRRLRGESSGDQVPAKHADWTQRPGSSTTTA